MYIGVCECGAVRSILISEMCADPSVDSMYRPSSRLALRTFCPFASAIEHIPDRNVVVYLSRHVPATRPQPLAPSGMREEGMWSEAEREDGMWSDAERATDILKRSRRPLLSLFLSSFFLPHATTCSLNPPVFRRT